MNVKLPVSVLVVIHTPGLDVLLLERSSRPGFWQSVTGSLERLDEPAREAARREVFEETGIRLEAEDLSLAEVMSYAAHGGTAHNLIYNATAPPEAQAVVNEEHLVARWYTPEAAIARFYDAGRLRSLGVGGEGIALAEEVARVLLAAQRARGMAIAGMDEPEMAAEQRVGDEPP